MVTFRRLTCWESPTIVNCGMEPLAKNEFVTPCIYCGIFVSLFLVEPSSTAQLEKIFEEFWWAFLIAVLVLVIVIVIVAVVCWYKRRKL